MNDHPIDLLADLAAGRLDPEHAPAVRAHLSGCAECRAELEAWRGIADAARSSVAEVRVPEALGAAIVARVAAEGSAAGARRRSDLGSRFAWLRSFVVAQVPLVRRDIWPATAVIMFIGAAISLLTASDSVPGAALALFAPLAAAVGIALIHGQENDPALELAVATPTSPRLVVVARLVVVLAWDLALALAASAVLVVANGPAVFLPIVTLWLGPMLFLGALTLLLSLFMSSSVAIGVAAVLWVLRAVQLTREVELHRFGALTASLDTIWQTTPLTLCLAALLLLVAVAVVPTRDRLSVNPV